MEHIDALASRLEGRTRQRLRVLARRIYLLRVKGRVTKREARKLFIRGYVALAMAEYAQDVAALKKMTDEHLVAQVRAVKETGERLRSLPHVRKADIKARYGERREVLEKHRLCEGCPTCDRVRLSQCR